MEPERAKDNPPAPQFDNHNVRCIGSSSDVITDKTLQFHALISIYCCSVRPGGCASRAQGHPAPWLAARGVIAKLSQLSSFESFELLHLHNEANTTHTTIANSLL